MIVCRKWGASRQVKIQNINIYTVNCKNLVISDTVERLKNPMNPANPFSSLEHLGRSGKILHRRTNSLSNNTTFWINVDPTWIESFRKVRRGVSRIAPKIWHVWHARIFERGFPNAVGITNSERFPSKQCRVWEVWKLESEMVAEVSTYQTGRSACTSIVSNDTVQEFENL